MKIFHSMTISYNKIIVFFLLICKLLINYIMSEQVLVEYNHIEGDMNNATPLKFKGPL